MRTTRSDASFILSGMGYTPGVDFLVHQGQSEATATLQWISADAEPTEAAIDAAALAAYQSSRIAAIRAESRQRIESKYPDWRQRSAALGVYPPEYVATMQSEIASVIAASNAAEDAVDAATTVAEVEAVTVTWPVI